ncbi:MAG: ABC transporter permease, partial [Ruthenibacterium sp.]
MSVSMKKNLVLFTILILMGLFFTFQNPKFMNLYNITNMVRQSLPNFVIGCAMTFVIASGYIDLSVGGLMALSAMFYGYLCIWGVNPWL